MSKHFRLPRGLGPPGMGLAKRRRAGGGQPSAALVGKEPAIAVFTPSGSPAASLSSSGGGDACAGRMSGGSMKALVPRCGADRDGGVPLTTKLVTTGPALVRPLSRRAALAGAAAALLSVAVLRRRAAGDEMPITQDALTPVRDRYAVLKSYADTGTVLSEQQWQGAPVVRNGGSFKTFFRAPRNFYFEFVDDPATGDDRLVIWCDGGDFQSWWKATDQHEVYDGGRGALAFLLGVEPSMGTSNVVPGLIFATADLGGAVAGLREAKAAGEEEVDGKRLAKIEAETLVAGNAVSKRPTKVWVEPDTLLMHKVLEDTPTDSMLDRRTTVLKPQADIDIEDARFKFDVPH
jgi:hypothetical protein